MEFIFFFFLKNYPWILGFINLIFSKFSSLKIYTKFITIVVVVVAYVTFVVVVVVVLQTVVTRLQNILIFLLSLLCATIIIMK